MWTYSSVPIRCKLKHLGLCNRNKASRWNEVIMLFYSTLIRLCLVYCIHAAKTTINWSSVEATKINKRRLQPGEGKASGHLMQYWLCFKQEAGQETLEHPFPIVILWAFSLIMYKYTYIPYMKDRGSKSMHRMKPVIFHRWLSSQTMGGDLHIGMFPLGGWKWHTQLNGTEVISKVFTHKHYLTCHSWDLRCS